MKKIPYRLVLILAFLLLGSALVPESSAEPVRSKRKVTHHLKKQTTTKSKRHRKRSRKSRRMKCRPVPPEKSLALLRQYLPEVAGIYESNPKNESETVIPVGHGYDFRSPFSLPESRTKLINNINDWLGTRYRYGGKSGRGIDCSGFTSTVLTSSMGKLFVGSSKLQAQHVERVELDELQFGDLMFFTGRNRRSGKVGHVGIYIGNGVFAHSSTGRGVIYTHISEGYYKDRFLFGGRIIAPAYAGTPQTISGKL